MNSSSGFFKWWLPPSGGGGYNATTTDWIAQVIANGGSVTGAEATAISTYTDAIQIGEFDRLWVHGLQNEIAAKTSIVNPTSTMITNVNSTTFTAGEGFTGNGTTMYLNTNYNPSTQGVKYTQNSALGFAYSTLDVAAATHTILGSNDGTNLSVTIYPKYAPLGNSNLIYANDASANFLLGAVDTDTLGTYVGLRDGANSNKIYKNGTLLNSGVTPSASIPNYNVFLLALNNSNTPNNLFSGRSAITGFGSHLANAGLNSANNTLATTLGFNV